MAPKPVKGSVYGTFVGWGAGSDGRSQTVCVQMVPKGRSSKVSLNVPNSSPKSVKATPAAFVTKAANSIKLGDTVKIGYSSLGKKIWMTSLSRSAGPSKSERGSPGVDQTAAEAFVFVATRKVRTSAGMSTAVLARKGSNMWKFSLPPEPAETKTKPEPYSRSMETSDSAPKKPPSLSEQVAAFSPGDIVALGYKTVDFKFVLESIAPHRMSATGRLLQVGKRSIRGVMHDAVFVRTTSKQSLSLIVPTTTSTGSKTNAEALASTLKTLKAGQNVDITYRRQKGVTWLEKITISATAVTAKSTR